jgi:hypothetical protein
MNLSRKDIYACAPKFRKKGSARVATFPLGRRSMSIGGFLAPPNDFATAGSR